MTSHAKAFPKGKNQTRGRKIAPHHHHPHHHLCRCRTSVVMEKPFLLEMPSVAIPTRLELGITVLIDDRVFKNCNLINVEKSSRVRATTI